MNNWTNHKIKQRIYIKEYIDLETGEKKETNKENNTQITNKQQTTLS